MSKEWALVMADLDPRVRQEVDALVDTVTLLQTSLEEATRYCSAALKAIDKARAERDEARAVANQLLPYCRGREDLLLGVTVHLQQQHPWLKQGR